MEVGRKYATFLACYALLFQEWLKKRFVLCMEKVLRMTQCVKSDLGSFMLRFLAEQRSTVG